MPIRFLSSDLNGTLVVPHTMQEMIRRAFPGEPERFARARKVFTAQTEGRLPIEEAFRIAGEQTRGLSLREAIAYASEEMTLMKGYEAFMEFIKEKRIRLAVVSTGYSVTLYTLRYSTPTPPFQMRCNRLLFSDPHGRILGEEELEDLVRGYFQQSKPLTSRDYDRIRATGDVVLGIEREEDKARFALEMARELGIPPSQVAHMGDTMGDSGGILGVARAGGLGIAFNYNNPLAEFLRKEGSKEMASGRIVLVDPKGPDSDLRHVLPYLQRRDAAP
jgi:phosphoserine phosphatase